ncbi:hypothetical protein MD588_07115 [Photobacterium sp. SDRW27]|uniref:hypothetical protein n=1 Tax=Photobacterium obscurum TaxID=2829490 RepID=UPI0022439B85|nr:hypothetical protein [Photobacterium obscurum]MCW8328575.1 hypothetical protein [Photobacterium obscurum]
MMIFTGCDLLVDIARCYIALLNLQGVFCEKLDLEAIKIVDKKTQKKAYIQILAQVQNHRLFPVLSLLKNDLDQCLFCGILA